MDKQRKVFFVPIAARSYLLPLTAGSRSKRIFKRQVTHDVRGGASAVVSDAFHEKARSRNLNHPAEARSV